MVLYFDTLDTFKVLVSCIKRHCYFVHPICLVARCNTSKLMMSHNSIPKYWFTKTLHFYVNLTYKCLWKLNDLRRKNYSLRWNLLTRYIEYFKVAQCFVFSKSNQIICLSEGWVQMSMAGLDRKQSLYGNIYFLFLKRPSLFLEG